MTNLLRHKKVLLLLAVTLGAIVFLRVAPPGADAGHEGTWLSILRDRDTRNGIHRTKKHIVSKSKRNGKEAESAAAAKAVAEVTSRTLTGRALDQAGKPVPKTKITVRAAGSPHAIASDETAADGSYKIPALVEGTYDVLAIHADYVPLIRPNFTIALHSQSMELDFHLPLGANLNGKIETEDGKPLDKVVIASRRKLAAPIRKDGKIMMDDSTYQTQITDEAGTFTLAGVSVGANIIELRRPGYQSERMELDITPKKAKEPLKIVMKRTGVLAGTVTNEEGHPVPGAKVHLTRYKPLTGAAETIDKDKITATSDDKGKFKFTKLYNEGYYDLLVEEGNYAPGVFNLINAGTEQVSCRLNRGGEIFGVVKYIDRETTEASVLVFAEAVVKGTTVTREAVSVGSGEFQLKRLPFGSYKLWVDDGKVASEPREPVAVEREKPATNVTLEIYETAHLKGLVADSRDNRPVPNAEVAVRATYGKPVARNREFKIRTNPHGEFELKKMPSGIHVAQATAKGFMAGATERSQQTFSLEPAEHKNDLTLLLSPGGVIEGFVLDPHGRALPDADVQAFPASQADGRIDPKNLTAKTDHTGFFKIEGIETGERAQLFVSVRKSGYPKTRSDMVEITPEESTAQVQISMQEGASIRGIVTDRNQLPIPQAQIKFVSHSFPGDPSPSETMVYTQPNGTFEVPACPAGGGSLSIARSGYVKQSRHVQVRPPDATDNIHVLLELGQRIAGRVTDLDGNPIAGAKVVAHGLYGAQGSEDGTTDKEGKYQINNLGMGTFNLTTSFKLKTPDGDQQYSFKNGPIRVGSLDADIDCDVGNQASGRVVNEEGKVLDKFKVVLRSKAANTPDQNFVFNLDKNLTTARGFYRFLQVPRGIYDMTILSDGYEPHREEDIAIGPHRRTVFREVSMKAAGGVTGVVVSSSTGRPVNNASIRLIDTALAEGVAQSRASTGQTNFTGTFHIASVPNGTYRIQVNHPNYIIYQMEHVSITRKSVRDLGKLHLEAGGGVRGTVTNDQGDPLPGIEVRVSGMVPARATTTDAAGNYSLQGLRFGNWPLVVKGTVNNRRVYTYEQVNVQRDDTKKVNFLLETSADLVGTLLAQGENVPQSTSIQIHPFNEHNVVMDDLHYDANTGGTDFKIAQVPPGRYFLWAAGQGVMSSFTAWKETFLNRGVNRESLALPASILAGQVVNPLGNPVPGIGIQVQPLMNTALSHNLYSRLVKNTVSQPDGYFRIPAMQAGPWQVLNQSAAGGWYAQVPVQLNNFQQTQQYIQLEH